MAYVVSLKRSTERELEDLPAKIQVRVIKRLISLKGEPRPTDAKKLHGREAYRLRVGDYRILYEVNDSARKVDVFSIAHRREIYRG